MNDGGSSRRRLPTPLPLPTKPQSSSSSSSSLYLPLEETGDRGEEGGITRRARDDYREELLW